MAKLLKLRDGQRYGCLQEPHSHDLDMTERRHFCQSKMRSRKREKEADKRALHDTLLL